jgi:hypothetical protein
MTDEADNKAGKREKPEPRRAGGKTKRGAAKKSTKKSKKEGRAK